MKSIFFGACLINLSGLFFTVNSFAAPTEVEQSGPATVEATTEAVTQAIDETDAIDKTKVESSSEQKKSEKNRPKKSAKKISLFPKNAPKPAVKNSPAEIRNQTVSSSAGAQGNIKNVYVSDVDQDLAIKSIGLLPVTDNVGSIYAKPIEEELRKTLNNDKQWSLSEIPRDISPNVDLLEEKPAEVKRILQSAKSEALLQCGLVKGPRGISVNMTLYVGREGFPFLQESLVEYKGFEINDVKNQVTRMFENLRSRMPFRGNILSRRGQEVTLNLGSDYGLKADSRVSVVQVLKVNRHPKLKILISTEKEVLGRVKLFKVEPYMSFGYVELEKEPGLISVGAKVVPDEFVKYALPVVTPSGKVLQDITLRPDKALAFGEDPKEWSADSIPQYGKVEFMGGLMTYNQNAKLTTAGSVSGKNSMAPVISVRGELWLNPAVFMSLGLSKSIFKIDNGLSGSSPGSLSVSSSQYQVGIGYNFLLTEQFFGPKLQVSGSYVSTDFSVDDSSPMAFTKMTYGGVLLGLAGQFPISSELPVDLGAKLDLYLSPTLNENSKSGASSTNKINSFSFFLDYRLRTRFKIRGELKFDAYNSEFTGTGDRTDPATSIDHQLTTLLAGVQYLF